MIEQVSAIAEAFRARTGAEPQWLVQACGRANIIGEHTDYNDGLVMPGAINRFLFFAARPNGTHQLRMWALDIDAYEEATLSTHLQPGTNLWANYALGIAAQFQLAGHTLMGLDIVFGGNLPIGAGVSSSAALETGLATIWNEALGAGLDKPSLALLAQRSSHQFVGIPCGIMDQFASLMGQRDQLILLDCRSLHYELIPAHTGDYGWVLLNSKVHHSLALSAYPARVQECRTGQAAIAARFAGTNSLRDASLDQLEAIKTEVSEVVYKRCRYVIEEIARTRRAADCLKAGQLEALGNLLYQTHEGLRDAYEVSCEEIDFLVNFAAAYPGVLGSRLMGGGFGGCTLSLVHNDRVEAFTHDALAAYAQAMGRPGEALFFSLVDGTRLV